MTYWRRWRYVAALAVLTAWMGLSPGIGGEPTADSDDANSRTARVSVEVARQRAKLMHDVYAATLEVLHHRYFHDSRAIVPARAMEDIFSDMASQQNINARWISVNTKAMSLQHEPKSDFEKKAASEIAAGTSAIELVEEGFYRRATAIPLAEGCVSCHAGMFAEAPKSPRFAGLVISIPVNP